jgi:hypothetical protein
MKIILGPLKFTCAITAEISISKKLNETKCACNLNSKAVTDLLRMLCHHAGTQIDQHDILKNLKNYSFLPNSEKIVIFPDILVPHWTP